MSYLEAHDISSSISVLSESRVRSTFFNYCILLAVLTTTGDPERIVELNGRSLKPYVDEAALCLGNDAVDSHYFSPFDNQYKSEKYWSNGPSDTIPRWATQGGPVDVISSAKVKTVRVHDFNTDELESFFLLTKENRPNLSALAKWWYRQDDLDSLGLGHNITEWDLCMSLLHRFGLIEEQAESIFDYDKDQLVNTSLSLSEDRAPYRTFLPEYSKKADAPKPSMPYISSTTYSPDALNSLLDIVAESGFNFSPLQVTTFVTAVRSNPFVILAGPSGTGKTHLPMILAETTQSRCEIVSVKPNWTDSSDLLGYVDLHGNFQQGVFTKFLREANADLGTQYFFILDEMNLARIEYYFAEVLSAMETMKFDDETGTSFSRPLLAHMNLEEAWSQVRLSSNVTIVGSINLDETTNALSPKVLDRAFVLDFSEVSLATFGVKKSTQSLVKWSSELWGSRRVPISSQLDPATVSWATDIAKQLEAINRILSPGGVGFAYRLRDHVLQFLLAARDLQTEFRSLAGDNYTAMDIALYCKVLPRIEGSNIRLQSLTAELSEFLEQATGSEGREPFLRCRRKLDEMLQRFDSSGYISFWA